MSNCQPQVVHEFIPKLIRRKVDAAIANREAFVLEKQKQMIPYLLANRNASIAFRAKPWYKRIWATLTCDFMPIPSIEETVLAATEDYDDVVRAMCLFRWPEGRGYDLDPIVHGPHYAALKKLKEQIDLGSKWVDHIYDLRDNLKRTPTRRVHVSESVLTSITYWAARGQG